jgi:hypothetical protein
MRFASKANVRQASRSRSCRGDHGTGAERAAQTPDGTSAQPREIGSVATTIVPAPGGLSSSSRPRSAAARSLIPTSP